MPKRADQAKTKNGPYLRPLLVHVPIGLVLFRLALAPLILCLGLFHARLPVPGWVFILLLTAGILSDIFDGIIARRLGVASAGLRRMDSQTDMLFWLSIAVASYLIHPEIVWRHAWELGLLIASEVLCYSVSFLRFGRETCTHSYLAKIYGLALFAGMVSMLGLGQGGAPVHLMFGVGMVTNFDVLLIVLLLPEWGHDIPSSLHALQRRRAAA
jgi:phosphatidylglycerophosphate synthase